MIQRSRRSKEMVVHIDKLKACEGSTPESWISVEPSVIEESSNEGDDGGRKYFGCDQK